MVPKFCDILRPEEILCCRELPSAANQNSATFCDTLRFNGNQAVNGECVRKKQQVLMNQHNLILAQNGLQIFAIDGPFQWSEVVHRPFGTGESNLVW